MDDSQDLPPTEAGASSMPEAPRGHTALQFPQLLHIQVDSGAGSAQLSLVGELDMSSAPALYETLVELETSGVKAITVDLSGLDFIDSSGLRILLDAHRRAQDSGRRLTLIPGSPSVQAVFEITGVEGVLNFS